MAGKLTDVFAIPIGLAAGALALKLAGGSRAVLGGMPVGGRIEYWVNPDTVTRWTTHASGSGDAWTDKQGRIVELRGETGRRDSYGEARVPEQWVVPTQAKYTAEEKMVIRRFGLRP